MPTPMRFRTDSMIAAEAHAKVLAGGDPPSEEWCPRAEWEQTPAVEPGDVWRCHWSAPAGSPEGSEGPVAGYFICCPKCRQVHAWTAANNCGSRKPFKFSYENNQGETVEAETFKCDHSGIGSCWTWTGSAEDNTLDAKASLFANGPGMCGYHGFLNAGVLTDG